MLVRKRAKPGCAASILSYFRGELGEPTTLRGRIDAEAEHLERTETEEEMEIVRKWEKRMDGPLLGPLVDVDGNEVHVNREPESKVEDSRRSANLDSNRDHALGSKMRDRQYDTNDSHREDEAKEDGAKPGVYQSGASPYKGGKAGQDDLRILVIGDRLFTDTLLANRLARLLPRPRPSDDTSSPASTSTSTPSVISIHTTTLPQPNDVRFLRWVEEKLTKGRIREGPIDWGRYVIRDTSDASVAALAAPLSWRERLNPFRDTPALTWHPRSWRPAPLLVGLGSGLWFVSRHTGRGLYRLLSRAWEGEVEVARALADRAKPVKEAEKAVEKVETAESVLTDRKVASSTSQTQ